MIKVALTIILALLLTTQMAVADISGVEYINIPLPDDSHPDQEVVKATSPRTEDGDFQAGVAFFAHGNDAEFKSNTEKALDRLASLNVNSVSLSFPIFQDGWRSNRPYIDKDSTLSDENIRFFIRQADKRNMTVMLRVLLDESTFVEDGRWRGLIEPENREEWFENYLDIMIKYTEIAQKEGVEIINVGTELSSLEGETEMWVDLITKIRKIYDGQLTYSVNWHNAFDSDMVWQKLDFISMDAFFPMEELQKDATTEEIIKAWRPWMRRVEEIKRRYGKAVVFTEVGTVSQAGSFRSPWRSEHGTEMDLNTQKRYYKATFESSLGVVDGIYWWAVEQNSINLENDSEFSPLNKPAEEVIKKYYNNKGGK